MTRVYAINVYNFGIKAMHTYGAEHDLNDHTRWWFTNRHFARLMSPMVWLVKMFVFLKAKGAHDPEEYYIIVF